MALFQRIQPHAEHETPFRFCLENGVPDTHGRRGVQTNERHRSGSDQPHFSRFFSPLPSAARVAPRVAKGEDVFRTLSIASLCLSDCIT